MRPLLLLCSALLFQAPSGSAQADLPKEDILEAIAMILSLPETEALYQHSFTEGLTLLLYQPERPYVGNRRTDVGFYHNLSDRDFSRFPRPVQLLNRFQAADFDIEPRYLTHLGITTSPNRIRIGLSSTLFEDEDFYLAQFALVRENSEADWEIHSRYFEIR
ncbi:MAG: hypothetical protein AAFW73_20860 [Bacteroidota bacterium]